MSTPNFTARQLEALDVSRRHVDACIVAGPGSGKTTVLVEYFRRLVAEGVDPARILAITFTEKAAAQMRRRLAKAFAENAEVRAKLERAWVSTVHGFCARLLKENAVAAGVDPGFTIAEEREVGRWQQESLAEAMESIFTDHPAGVRALILGLASDKFEAAILSAYDAMRGAGTRTGELAAFPTPSGTDIYDIAETLGELRGCDIADWNGAQCGHRPSKDPARRTAQAARMHAGHQAVRLRARAAHRGAAPLRRQLSPAENPGGRAGFRGPRGVRRGSAGE